MTELEELRKKIEEITVEMLSLLKIRTEIAQEIGKIKNEQGMSVQNESREDDLRELIKKECKKIGFDETAALKFLNFILNGKLLNRSLKIGTNVLQSRTYDSQSVGCSSEINCSVTFL